MPSPSGTAGAGHDLGADSPGTLLRQVPARGDSRRRHRLQRPARLRSACPGSVPTAASWSARGGAGPVDSDPGGIPRVHGLSAPGPPSSSGTGTRSTPPASAPESCRFALQHRAAPAGRRHLEPGRDPPPARGHRAGVDQLVGAAPGLRGAVAGPGRTTAAGCCKALTFQPERRDRRRRDHVAARGRRRGAQLGLPLLLGARRQLHHGGAVGGGLPGRGRRTSSRSWPRPRPPPSRPGRRGAADHVRRRRRARPHRARAGPPAGLAGQRPGPGGQRRLEPAPARRLRRAARRRRTGCPTSWTTRRRTPGGSSPALADAAAARWREPDQGIWEVRGEPRHFLLLQADVLGGPGPGHRPRRPAAGDRVAAVETERGTRSRRPIRQRGLERRRPGAFTQCVRLRATWTRPT